MSCKIVTRQDLAKTVAENWKRAYYNSTTGQWSYGIDIKAKIYDQLVALGDTPNPDDVDKIIHNDSWTMLYCHICGEKTDKVISFTMHDDYDCTQTKICLSCFNEGVNLFSKTGVDK